MLCVHSRGEREHGGVNGKGLDLFQLPFDLNLLARNGDDLPHCALQPGDGSPALLEQPRPHPP